MNNHPFEAIIFDHDGTLVDTETPDLRACQMLYEQFGTSITAARWAEIAIGHQEGYKTIFAELIEWHQHKNNGKITEAILRKRLKSLEEITCSETQLMPGVIQLLPQLQAAGYPLAVATASEQKRAIHWLTRFKLRSYFQAIVGGDAVAHNKPAPDVYLHAAEQLNISPEACLVFEDSAAGIQAAKAAGMFVIAVPNPITKTLDLSQADETVPDLTHVTLSWIKDLGKPI